MVRDLYLRFLYSGLVGGLMGRRPLYIKQMRGVFDGAVGEAGAPFCADGQNDEPMGASDAPFSTAFRSLAPSKW